MSRTVEHPLSGYVARLCARGGLNAADLEALHSLRACVEVHPAGAILVQQGDPVRDCIFLIDGFLSRTKIMLARPRQILAFCVPGDAVDLQSLFLDHADHALEAHSSSTIAKVRQTGVAECMRARPNVMRALWLDALLEAAIFREWTANLGGRSARQRIAHLLLELEVRHRRPIGEPFPLPVKQAALASAVGFGSPSATN